MDIIISSATLAGIEFVRVYIQRAGTPRSFGDYSEFFKTAKAKHPVVDEAHAMEDDVATTPEGSDVRIVNCWHLFVNTAGNPIPTIN
jgi:hypothetical protein